MDKITVNEFTLKMKKRNMRLVEDHLEKLNLKLKILDDVKGKRRKNEKIDQVRNLITQFKGLTALYEKEIKDAIGNS